MISFSFEAYIMCASIAMKEMYVISSAQKICFDKDQKRSFAMI